MKKLLLSLALLLSANVFATPVNINTADAQTIAKSLNGIGAKKADAIVEYRTKNGPFKTLDDVAKVSGIGAKTIEKNKADILFADTSVAPATTTAPSADTSKPVVPAADTSKKK